MGQGLILIADDEPIVRKALGIVLSRAGFDVIEAEDGEAAVEIMQQGTMASHVNVLLCDLRMPRLDGQGTIDYFKANHPLIPIVVMTGAPDFIVTEVLRRQGVTDYLMKPSPEKRVVEVVRVAVNLHKIRVQQEG